jgi:hypothetical protein
MAVTARPSLVESIWKVNAKGGRPGPIRKRQGWQSATKPGAALWVGAGGASRPQAAPAATVSASAAASLHASRRAG